MKQKKPTRQAEAAPPAKPERKGPIMYQGAIVDELTQWINRRIARACRLGADEMRYTRGKDGLTVEISQGTRVLAARGPHKLYQDKAIPRLKKWAHMDLSDERPRQTGKFGALVDGHEWDMPVSYTKTSSGERLVVRLIKSKL